MNDKTMKVGRLAMRHEGNYWNAYYAMPDTMADALLLGSIRFVSVSGPKNAQRKAAFMAMMVDLVADLIEERTGTRPTFPDGARPAPESERAGHG